MVGDTASHGSEEIHAVGKCLAQIREGVTALRVSHDSSDRNLSSTVETYPLNQSQISIFTEEVLKLAMSKGQITAWDLYNVATEIYKPGKTDFPALIPQNGAMAELLLSRLSEEVEVQDAVPIN